MRMIRDSLAPQACGEPIKPLCFSRNQRQTKKSDFSEPVRHVLRPNNTGQDKGPKNRNERRPPASNYDSHQESSPVVLQRPSRRVQSGIRSPARGRSPNTGSAARAATVAPQVHRRAIRHPGSLSSDPGCLLTSSVGFMRPKPTAWRSGNSAPDRGSPRCSHSRVPARDDRRRQCSCHRSRFAAP